MSVEALRAQLDSQITEPSTGGTRADRRADMNRYLDDCQVQIERLDEEHWLLLADDHAAVCMSHELVWSWETALADRWWRALPERYMTPTWMNRPDWDHSHYPHDEHGHTGRVSTRERPKTEADTETEKLVAAILADLASEEYQE